MSTECGVENEVSVHRPGAWTGGSVIEFVSSGRENQRSVIVMDE